MTADRRSFLKAVAASAALVAPTTLVAQSVTPQPKPAVNRDSWTQGYQAIAD